jgi:hypothetical protein
VQTNAAGRGPLATAAGQPSASKGGGSSFIGYPKGRWRLAQPEELRQVVLWVSHIVIAHEGSNPASERRLRPMGWHPDPPNPARSEGAALEMAQSLAERLARHPEDFERAARDLSDDVVTRRWGGSLGGVLANRLPPAYLDALSAVRIGEVSRVVRTGLGFAILLQHPPPADMEVSGDRILVRHRDADARPEDAKVERTRDEARVVAEAIVKRLRSSETTFEALVASSDSVRWRQPGDMGVWKTRNPMGMSLQVEALSRLKVGEISDPIESNAGFEVLQRTTGTRRLYAMKTIRIPSSGTDHDGGTSPAAALADSLAAELEGHPERFDMFFEKYCCREPMRWSHGKAPPEFEPVLDRLAIGQIAQNPILVDGSYCIPMRLEPSTLPEDEPVPRFELPSPVAAQLAPMVEGGDGPALAQRTRELAKEAVATMALEPSQSTELVRLFDELATSFEAHPGVDAGLVRVQSLEATQAAFLKLLGPAQNRRLTDAIDAFTTRMILSGVP